jgi:large subunit ribosomal protein L28
MEGAAMSRKCKLTGKRPVVANLVSHANNRTKRRQIPNLQTKRLYIDELGRSVRVRLSTSALRTVSKKGLMPFLREQGLKLRDVEC